MLEVRDLSAGYGVIQILRGVSLDVGRGEIVALLGSNGAGKSTLNNVLSRITPPTAGSVRFDGEDIHAAKPGARGRAGPHPGARRPAHLSQPDGAREPRARKLSARTGKARPQPRASEAIFPRLAERWEQLAGSLSGGEQQMLAIGRGLMSEPKLLILDEPSLGLSPLLVETMFALIQRINQDGLSILLVEQNVVQSLAIAHRGYVLENGVIALAGTGKRACRQSQPQALLSRRLSGRLLLSLPGREDVGAGRRPHAAATQHAIQHLLDGGDAMRHAADPRSAATARRCVRRSWPPRGRAGRSDPSPARRTAPVCTCRSGRAAGR